MQQRSFAQPLRCEMFRSSGFLSEQVCEIVLILPKLCHAKNTAPCTPEPPSSPARPATQQHVFIRKYLAFFCTKLLHTHTGQAQGNQFSNATHSNHLHQECGPPPNQCSNAALLSPLDVKCSVPPPEPPSSPARPATQQHVFIRKYLAFFCTKLLHTHTGQAQGNQFSNATHSNHLNQEYGPPPNQCSNAALLSPLDVKCSIPQAFCRNRSVKLLSSCQSFATQRTLRPAPLNPLHLLQERQLSSTSSFASIWPSSEPSCYTHTGQATHSNHLHQECGPPPNQCNNAALLSPLDVKCSVPQAFSRNRSVKLLSSCQSSATQRTLSPVPLNPLHPLQERQLSSTSSFASIWPSSAPSCYTHRPSTTINSATQHTPTTSIKNVDHHPTNAATQLCSAP